MYLFFNYVDKTYLNEKIAYLKNKIEDDLVKRDKLITMLDQQNSEEQIENVKKLENEIKNFKKIKQNCLTTFSQLTDEINELKKEIAKHSEKMNYDLNNFTSVKENRLRKIKFVSPKKLYQK
jgi:ferritin